MHSPLQDYRNYFHEDCIWNNLLIPVRMVGWKGSKYRWYPVGYGCVDNSRVHLLIAWWTDSFYLLLFGTNLSMDLKYRYKQKERDLTGSKGTLTLPIFHHQLRYLEQSVYSTGRFTDPVSFPGKRKQVEWSEEFPIGKRRSLHLFYRQLWFAYVCIRKRIALYLLYSVLPRSWISL